MSDYKIKSIGKVDFREYKDVVRVIATKKRGFWTSLFSSPIEAYFILSEDSPLYGAVNAAKNNKSIWDVPETSFTVERVNDRFYRVEKSIALYEKKRLNDWQKLNARQMKHEKLKNSKLNEKERKLTKRERRKKLQSE